MSRARLSIMIVALVAGFSMFAADFADARVGGGGGVGSRGGRTFSAPPPTKTAPKAAPIEKSMTPRTASPAQAAQPQAQGSRFGGMRGLLMGGLFALALGSIFGFGALASVLGFVLQFALIGGLVYLAFAFFQRRNQPAVAARGTAPASPRTPQAAEAARSYGGPAPGPSPTLAVGDADLDTFEILLGKIQTAFAQEDTETLGAVTTPEMLSHFSQELADNAKRGVHNEVSGVKLLQGDVSEAWRENGSDYATVAMRYSLVDAVVDRVTGRVVSGDRSRPSEVVELWTFRRDDRTRGEGWQLSAIQQAA